MCGGTASSGSGSAVASGLSPRVRGNPCRLPRPARNLRSIPACAGEPGRVGATPRPATVYPRVCGGTFLPGSQMYQVRGLSPRVRGNPGDYSAPSGGKGSIPACAGEPPASICRWPTGWVYPRVCGGTIILKEPPRARAGLSPRVRGNHRRGYRKRWIPRSIPACAGEPAPTAPSPVAVKVYPRVCGGTFCAAPRAASQWGLSPRVRGNPVVVAAGVNDGGSIPACAGEPGRGKFRRRLRGVYPRVCGGTIAADAFQDLYGGLSPRVRGNPPGCPRLARAYRSIPACAGEPTESALPAKSWLVYPRVCGGT